MSFARILSLAALLISLAGTAIYYYQFREMREHTNLMRQQLEKDIGALKIQQESMNTELAKYRGNDVPFPKVEAYSSASGGIRYSEQGIANIFKGRKTPAAPPPDGPDHITGFFDEPASTDQRLRATSLKKAWVMAYIEKHVGDYSYQGRKIYTFGDRNGKRDAIIRLVKQEGADKLFDKIAPKM